MHFYHLFELNSKFCVCSFYDANEAHKIEELSLLFFVNNFEYYTIPLGTPHFEGDDYSFWSHKIRSHLFSLHPSIWEIVENRMHFDNSDNPVFINEQIH
jgi:hypothetical protein